MTRLFTYTEHSAGMFICPGGYSFNAEEEAAEFCSLWNEHRAAMEQLKPLASALSRAEYENACQALNVPIKNDSDCDSYGVQYGEFGPYSGGYRMEKYTPEFCVGMALASRRMHGIEAERKAVPRVQHKYDYPNGRELACGCTIYDKIEVMNASMGSSCVDCYNRMSM